MPLCQASYFADTNHSGQHARTCTMHSLRLHYRCMDVVPSKRRVAERSLHLGAAGWMMGPWLVFAALLNRCAMALFQGPPAGRPFGEFVCAARVTMLGVVSKS
jgi:acyl-coenzyme A synthetase/AMP-(fatty) acid ligase